jgi:hypothetical protein
VPRVAGRTNEHTQMLKDAAYELAQAGKPSAFIAERLTAVYDLGLVTVRQVNRWLNERFNATRDETIANVFNDVEYLRQRAYDATEKSRTNLAFLAERNYWWSLYISALHIVLRTALAPVAEPAGRLQFVFPNMAAVEQWYADIRARRQLIPPLQGAPARESTDEDDVLAQCDAFDAEYGRDIKLPSEVL